MNGGSGNCRPQALVQRSVALPTYSSEQFPFPYRAAHRDCVGLRETTYLQPPALGTGEITLCPTPLDCLISFDLSSTLSRTSSRPKPLAGLLMPRLLRVRVLDSSRDRFDRRLKVIEISDSAARVSTLMDEASSTAMSLPAESLRWHLGPFIRLTDSMEIPSRPLRQRCP